MSTNIIQFPRAKRPLPRDADPLFLDIVKEMLGVLEDAEKLAKNQLAKNQALTT